MYAITIDDDALRWDEQPAPKLSAGDVRVEVAAAGVNRADLLQRQGLYPPPPGASAILGLEVSGTITEIGASVTGWSVGDRVCALLPGGGYASEAVVPAGLLLPVPGTVDLIEAAALPEVVYTAFLNLAWEGELREGESVLIHAAASGVGTAALQIARLLGASTIFGSASAGKLERVRELGADHAIEGHDHPWHDEIFERTDGQGVDVILDLVGGSYLARNQLALAPAGRVVVVGLLGGRSAEIDLGRLLRKRQRIIGSVLRSRSLKEKERLTRAIEARVWSAVEDGTLRPVIDRVLPIEKAEEAHRLLSENRTVGKILLRVSPESRRSADR